MFWPILFRKTWPLLFDMLMVLFLAKTPQSFLSNSSIQADTHFPVFFCVIINSRGSPSDRPNKFQICQAVLRNRWVPEP